MLSNFLTPSFKSSGYGKTEKKENEEKSKEKMINVQKQREICEKNFKGKRKKEKSQESEKMKWEK